MHTTKVKIEGPEDVTVHHNADWSGEARVTWTERGEVFERRLPGRLLIALSRTATAMWFRGEIGRAVEDVGEAPL